MARYFIEVGYEGTSFCGFQIQDGQETVQSVVAAALQTVLKEPILLTGSSRTDAGVHEMVPGLTGWAQVNGRDELPIPDKVKLDAEYLQRRSLGLDLWILWLTLLKVLRREGVSH